VVFELGQLQYIHFNKTGFFPFDKYKPIAHYERTGVNA
jgi:hypothetical protein